MNRPNPDDGSTPLPDLTPPERRVTRGLSPAVGGFLGAVVGGCLLEGFGVLLGIAVGIAIALLIERR